MRPGDIAPVLALLRRCEGVGLRAADSPPALRRYLRRNPRLSLVAVRDDTIVGCLFAGHDGRRGHLHHLAVDPAARRAGLGRALVSRAIASLHGLGIEKIQIDVFRTNRAALHFWKRLGWQRRDDIVRLSFIAGDNPDA